MRATEAAVEFTNDIVTQKTKVQTFQARSATKAPIFRLFSKFDLGLHWLHEYDPEERITKVTDSAEGVTEYTYDAQGQLLTETKNGAAVNVMTYDGYGNILSKNGKAYTYGNTVWRLGYIALSGIISSATNWFFSVINSFVNKLVSASNKDVVDVISCFFSTGGIFALLLDVVTDNRLDNRIKIF
ncbi:MAG: hypothetical protein IJV96_00355 [Clostridia bacterium]|nr:hypothetical protein [Clostridia bacterium]